ncbi:LADA_0A01266g1_1 [Lachancea dasiensis]|uniref:thymidylate synthase n=1 Tax=Lachancea dasiensis TaxID=1072105 RepID=A0A1G4IM11_9SACH|nr:LADA_0A01266g1_1 [Lachancea dasiensis]
MTEHESKKQKRNQEEDQVSEGNAEEQQYLKLCQNIIENGDLRPDRTGTGTYSLFAPPQLRFNLQNDCFPLLTTKKVFTKGIILELLWFISGCTDGKKLSEQGVKIWEGNGSREYLDQLGLTDRREGDLGPVYGFQWRHFGAKYRTCDDDYKGQGFDQLRDIIHRIKTNPTDRRIIMSAWNPPDFAAMALPPCHVFSHFYVTLPKIDGEKPKLSCLLYQRSADMGLGVPFNIASYALLTKLIAHVCDMEPGEFIHTLGDAHVYKDHVEALQEQIQRTPRQFPKLKIKRHVRNIDDFKYEDFEITDYHPHKRVHMKMSV